jgi:hypothetical protein
MGRLSFAWLGLLASACALSQAAAQPEEWRTYHDERLGYELQYPAGWTVLEAGPPTDHTTDGAEDGLDSRIVRELSFREPEGKVWPGEFVVRVHTDVADRTLGEWADATFTDVHGESLVTRVEETLLAGRAAQRLSLFGFDQTRIVVALVRDERIYEISYTGSSPNDPDLAEHRSIYEQMQQSFQLVPSVESEVFDLGGPCDDSRPPADYHARLREAARRGDHGTMIELQKQYVRAMCSNHYRWLDLAGTYLRAERPAMAIQVLHELHRRGAEIKPSSLEHQGNLMTLIKTPEFRRSELGRELRRLQAAAARRRAAFRTQLEALDVADRPPEGHVARGACPFECCTYREWDVLETTALSDAPYGSTVVGSAVKGHRVRGVTGDVHLQPAPVAVVHDHPPFVQGEIIFVLDYLGEGFSRYWRDGETAEAELWIDDLCLRPGPNCWAEYIQPPEERPDPQWWILIETDEGLRGWTDRPEHFGNKDACG